MEPKYDHVLACTDYDVQGNSCPFYHGGACRFFGKDTPIDAPENRICDKDDSPLSPMSALVFGVDPDLIMNDRQKMDTTWRDWAEAYRHYQLSDKERHKVEEKALYELTMRKGGDFHISLRTFRKRFKPNNIGLTEGEHPSFRKRVLDKVKWRGSLNNSGSHTFKERVALVVQWTEEDDGDTTYRYPHMKFYTRGSFTAEEWGQDYDEIMEAGFYDISKDYDGRKILVEFKWGIYGGGYYEPYETDVTLEGVEFIKVLE